MAQNVRGQTLIDAIVEVFQEARAALPADEVARRLRAAGFWGGKEPKSAEQMVDSYLTTRHAGMFESGPGGTFALKSVFLRPAARTAALVAAPSSPKVAPRPAPRPVPRVPPAPPIPSSVARPPAPPATPVTLRKKRKSFGSAAIAAFAPVGMDGPLPQALNVQLSFEDAMKLHLSLGLLLAKLNGHARPAPGAKRKAAALLRLNLDKRRIAVYERPLKRATRPGPFAPPGTADWGVEPG